MKRDDNVLDFTFVKYGLNHEDPKYKISHHAVNKFVNNLILILNIMQILIFLFFYHILGV